MNGPPSPRSRTAAARWELWLPLALFAGFVALVAAGLLRPASRDVKSAMIGKPLPEFTLRPAVAARPGLTRADLTGARPRLLNIFASWCVPCIAEAPQLEALRRAGVEIDGIAIRDTTADLEAFLARNGNPYARIGADEVSAIQFALGSSGVPESFVIDARGVVRYQHIGDITPKQVPLILAKLKEAEQ
ncbi:MAG: redoxin family protein [Novosphingobium sp.]|uniref:redoxin family protein n=1 Tax=Novosphingobium sp. TaxID=1874826 RepID=UPI0017F1CAFA|nr:redoxin family protein [Novosphingobium sp.]